MTQPTDLPTCPHRTNAGEAVVFCRHPHYQGGGRRPARLPRDTCLDCIHRHDQPGTLPAYRSPAGPCRHRGELIGSILSGCPACHTQPIHACDRHGRCVATRQHREELTAAQACAACRDYAPLTDDDLDQALDRLAVVVCHFNPLGYRRPIDNYARFVDALTPDVRRLVTVELSFGGPLLPIDHRSERIHITGDRRRHLLWQKEALLNIGFADVLRDPEIEFVAWIDADLIWDDPTFLRQGLRQIRDGAAAVQLFARMIWQGPDGELDSTKVAAAATFAANGKHHGCPGGAWLARADLLRHTGGLAPYNIIGGGDQFALEGLTGCRCEYAYRIPSQSLIDVDTAWIANCRDWITTRRLRSAFVDTTIRHLWHGHRANRQYDQRRQLLADYDPARDVRLNADGILEWTGTNPDLEAGVAAYFSRRREDTA